MPQVVYQRIFTSLYIEKSIIYTGGGSIEWAICLEKGWIKCPVHTNALKMKSGLDLLLIGPTYIQIFHCIP